MSLSATPHPPSRCGGSTLVLPVFAASTLCFALTGCDRLADRLADRRASADPPGLAAGFLSPRAPAARAALVTDRTLTLQENAEVINVSPEAVLDPRGGFLVSDEREAQIRRYSADGTLLWHAGRRGGGPGEFKAPTAVVRLPSGEVAAFDREGRLTVFDGDGGRVLRTFQTTLRHISDAAVLGDSAVLVAAIVEGNWNAPRLHVLDPATGAVRTGSFPFAPFRDSPARAAATIAGWVKVSVQGNRIAAIFATSDSVYLFDTGGRHLRTMPIPFAGFRAAPSRIPRDGNTNPRARMRWLSSFDLVADVHWLDGDLLVAWQSIDQTDAATRHWNVLRMTADGQPRAELREVPRLLEVDGERSALYFIAPDAEAPNRWIEAHLPR